MEIIYTKVSQPRWCLKVAALMVLLIFIHAKVISPFMGLQKF